MPRHASQGPEFCLWCGDGTNGLSRWHPECRAEYLLHTSPRRQREYLMKRDGPACRNCGGCNALEIEHQIPLWLVEHLPDDARRAYFGPSNLALWCKACHLAKTKQEAFERAKVHRQRQMAAPRPASRIGSRPFGPSRKFQSRGLR
jgi:5-methylcytosine-specific restriction endonuclease McrA